MDDTAKRSRGVAALEGMAFFAADLAVMCAAFFAAHLLRFNFHEPPYGWNPLATYWIPVFLVQCAALHAFKCDRVVWRFFSAYDVPRLVFAAAASTFLIALLGLVTRHDPAMRPWVPPGTVSLINGVLFMGGALLARMLWRLTVEGGRPGLAGDKRPAARRILIVGAGAAGNAVAHDIRQNRSREMEVAGFLDDDPGRRDAIIQGIRVYGPVASLREAVRELRVDEAMVTMARVGREAIRAIVHDCEELGIPVRITPGSYEAPDGPFAGGRIREVDVADLLGRDEVDVASDAELARFISGRSVVVTGAGGSIGSELSRQIARFGPERLVLVERAEPALYQIDRALRGMGVGTRIVPVAADIGDRARIRAIFAEHKPDLVVNAAAHKHVPMMECNAAEAVRNNVLSTRVLGEESVRAGVKAFVQLSTDKAVNPSSVMGASKRLAEFAVQDLNRAGSTRFSAVRFGNVLGASGSVVPLFREQIRAGGPVTVTHPDMRRYFMTIPEACRLVLQAATLAEGGEIFILDMGEPMRIVELAEEMIRLSGLRPYDDVQIVFTGLRPGEKLFEELSTGEEHADRTRNPRVFIGRIDAPSPDAVAKMLARFGELCGRAAGDGETRDAIADFVPENTFGK